MSVEASVHVTECEAGTPPTEHLCAACAGARRRAGLPVFATTQELERQGWISVSGSVLRAEEETLTLLVVHSSKFPPGTQLKLCKRIVPKEQRSPGAELSFCCPPEAEGMLILAKREA